MYRIKGILASTNIKPTKYQKYKSVYIVEEKNNKYVIKKKHNDEIINYLKTRNFDYYPHIINSDSDYQIEEYVEEIKVPDEQKIIDLVDIVSLLHYKTTHFKEIDKEDYKELYENIVNNIEYLNVYYNDLITVIESHEYMSPAEYVLARNVSKIFQALDFCKKEVENWYEEIKSEEKQRVVVLHNNLDMSHFIKNDSSYLLSWSKTKIGIPIFDIYKLYKRHGNQFDFESILKRYEEKYPLLVPEKRLFFILISLPDQVSLEGNVYKVSIEISEMVDLLYKTEKLISPYYAED